jgi:hypothetical protein
MYVHVCLFQCFGVAWVALREVIDLGGDPGLSYTHVVTNACISSAQACNDQTKFQKAEQPLATASCGCTASASGFVGEEAPHVSSLREGLQVDEARAACRVLSLAPASGAKMRAIVTAGGTRNAVSVLCGALVVAMVHKGMRM